ncbi:S-layer homology domain-containing protein [Salibacterium salarium]|uniref:S-layer homology domain-containing protein n=1 Tax=Salibacterium salarium TaxID=284579 RepID=A0A3R9R9B1_9BACI|nr:S-layer homology domain-containing protein [Salibacterium salarium]RSL30169.1 S-layer homology domain-containing protein [Salibacterium salarium]
MMNLKVFLVSAFLIFLLVPVYASADSGAFSDVEEDFWAADEINYLVAEDIVSGYDDGTFRPNETVKRSQAAAMLVEALELDTKDRPAPDFSDINADFHAYDVVAAVRDEAIISGKNGAFMPNDALTRGQMAAVLNRSFSLDGDAEDSAYFDDMEKTDAFYNDVQVIAQAGITTGYADGTFGPNDDVTRAQFAIFLSRALDQDQFVHPDHTTYSNTRFGFEVTYPDDWPDGEEAANGDGKTLYENGDSIVRAYGTHHRDDYATDLNEYQQVTLDNGKTAYYQTTRTDNLISFDLVRIAGDIEYHINGEVTNAFYSENADDIRDMLYSLVTSGVDVQ